MVSGVKLCRSAVAVCVPIVESVCNRLAVGGELLAGEVAEDVEALEGDEQGLGEFEEDVFDLRVVQGGGNA